MATSRSGDPVLRWAGEARRAEKATGVPASVLLGLISVESGGLEGRTSSAGAGGLTQFMPGTAAQYGVNVQPGHAAAQIMGAARYLVALGWAKDPNLALKSYNAGPGNPGAAGDYDRKVLSAARRYVGAGGSSGSTSTGGAQAPDEPASSPSSDGGGVIDEGKRSDALKALTWVALAAGGTALIGLGLTRTMGLRGGAA